MTDTISPQDLRVLLAEGKVTLLDVRRRADKEADPEMIPSATWQNPEKVEEWKKTIPAGAKVVIYCARGGSVSKAVLATLREAKHEATFIEGGIEAWKKMEQIK